MSVTLSEITASSTHLSGNDIFVKATSSGIPAGATDYKVLLKVTSPDGVLYGSPFVDGITPDAGVAWFNISGYVDQAIEKQISWPIPGLYSGKVTGYINMVYDIWLYPGERYIDSNGDLQESFGSPLQPVFIVKGKLPLIWLTRLNDAGSDWFSWFCSGGRWLTFMPLVQKVAPYQPVKLFWKPAATGGVTFTIKGYYSDGSTVTTTATPTLYADNMYEFDCYPPSNNIPPVATGKKLLYYEAWISSGGDLEKRTFVVDWQHCEQYWYLFADNQIGGVDCIWLKGDSRYSPTGGRIISGKPLERGSGVMTPSKIVSGNYRQRRWVLNTGYKDKSLMEALDILLDTPAAWLAIPPADGNPAIENYSITPVIVTSTELLLSDSAENLNSISIELTEAH